MRQIFVLCVKERTLKTLRKDAPNYQQISLKVHGDKERHLCISLSLLLHNTAVRTTVCLFIATRENQFLRLNILTDVDHVNSSSRLFKISSDVHPFITFSLAI